MAAYSDEIVHLSWIKESSDASEPRHVTETISGIGCFCKDLSPVVADSFCSIPQGSLRLLSHQ
jgi:hypothetical protein